MPKPHHLSTSLLILACLCLSSCATYRPQSTDNVCQIFRGDTDWYEAAVDANKRWGTPIPVMMAIIHQESRFVHNARPDRKWFLFIPLPRQSSAFGYAQAQDPAWHEYRLATRSLGADRDSFEDAIDFVGWYTDVTQKRLGTSKWDAYTQYLAYHEGRTGYQRGAWKKKPWLKSVANKVKHRAATYGGQLKRCKNELDDEIDGWF